MGGAAKPEGGPSPSAVGELHRSTDGHVLGSLSEPRGEGSLLIFRASPPGNPFQEAIFVRTADGEVHRLLGTGDSIDGREVVRFSGQADAQSVVVWLTSTDVEPYTALYRASFSTSVLGIPTLTPIGLVALIACLAAAGIWASRQI